MVWIGRQDERLSNFYLFVLCNFQVKRDLYKCVANHYIATLLLSESDLCEETLESFRYLYCEVETRSVTDIRSPSNEEDKKILGVCHLRQALTSLEDSVRHARLNRELRGKAGLQSALSSMKDRILATFERKEIQSQEELEQFLDPPQIVGEYSHSRCTVSTEP